MSFWNKKINSNEYLELKKDLSSLKLDIHELELDFALIVKKLKVKYKISKGEKADEEPKNINNTVLLPEDNGLA